MIFPKVKEFMFRVSANSPLEVAAKALAMKNDHAEKWTDYSFSCVSQDQTFQEVQIEDLSRTFQSLQQPKHSQDFPDIVLFYRVRHLEDRQR